LTAAWLLGLNIGLGVVIGEAGPALWGVSLCSVGVVISALYADENGLLARGRPLEAWERMALIRSLIGLIAVGAGLVAVGLASSSPPPRWYSYAAVVLALAAAGFALRVVMRH
jgi:protein-S-isoprenylcysteine O-methyltransferase Ste14